MNSIRLFWADCREVLCKLNDDSVDAIFVDPPYGTTNKTNKTPQYDQSDYMASRNWNAFHAEWDAEAVEEEFTYQWLCECKRVLKPKGSLFVCTSFHNLFLTGRLMQRLGFYIIQPIAWIIPNAMPHLAGMKMGNANQTVLWARKNEQPAHLYNYARAKAWNDGKNLRDFWKLDYTEEEWERFFLGLNEGWMVINNSNQATQEMPGLVQFKAKKPYALVARCLDLTLPEEETSLVVDCFAGSGTTGVVTSRIDEFIPLPREHTVRCVLVEKSKANIDQFITPRLGIEAIAGPGGVA
jgi:DNA modification methylase